MTGQASCYDALGKPIECAGTGQDGELQAGAARAFTGAGDGTIADTVTGLMWEKLSDDQSIHDKDGTYTWANASSKIAAINESCFAGHDDWRLPNAFELESLLSFGAHDPATYAEFDSGCTAACDPTTCSCTAAAPYWSATSYDTDPANGWSVSFANGEANATAKSGNLRVRTLRSAALDGVQTAAVVSETHTAVPVPGTFTLRQGNVDPSTLVVYARSPLPPFELVTLSQGVHYQVVPSSCTYGIEIVSLPPEFVVPGTYDFEVQYGLLSGGGAAVRRTG